MHQTLKFDLDGLDWDALAAIYAREDFAGRTAESLEANFSRAQTVCFCFDIDRLVGAARVSGGKVLDFCILQNALGYGPGLVMYEWLGKKSGIENPPITAPEGTERELIEKAELGEYLA